MLIGSKPVHVDFVWAEPIAECPICDSHFAGGLEQHVALGNCRRQSGESHLNCRWFALGRDDEEKFRRLPDQELDVICALELNRQIRIWRDECGIQRPGGTELAQHRFQHLAIERPVPAQRRIAWRKTAGQVATEIVETARR